MTIIINIPPCRVQGENIVEGIQTWAFGFFNNSFIVVWVVFGLQLTILTWSMWWFWLTIHHFHLIICIEWFSLTNNHVHLFNVLPPLRCRRVQFYHCTQFSIFRMDPSHAQNHHVCKNYLKSIWFCSFFMQICLYLCLKLMVRLMQNLELFFSYSLACFSTLNCV